MGEATIESRVQSYFGALEHDEHHRYRSWEHCYRFFQRRLPDRLAKERDEAAMQLGFYLASWECAADVHSYRSAPTPFIEAPSTA